MANTNSLIAATLQKHEPEVVDNITKDFILFKLFGDKDLAPKLFQMRKPPEGAKYADGLKLTDDPGRTIVEKIRKSRNSTVNAYERFDIIDTTAQDNFLDVEMQWKSIAGTVNLCNEDLDKNSGSKTKIFDLLMASEDDLEVSMQEKLNDYLLGTVPNDVEGKKRPTGLLDWVQDDPTSLPAAGAAVIGGIDASASANSYWRNQVVNHASVTFGSDQTGTGPSNLRSLIRKCTFGEAKGSNIIIAGETAFEALEKSLLNYTRYNDPRVNALVAAGFDAIIFKNVPVVMEKQIDTQRSAASLTASAFYHLNSHTLRLWGMKKRWFKFSDFREPTNQDSQVAKCIARLQMTCRARRRQGVMFAVA